MGLVRALIGVALLAALAGPAPAAPAPDSLTALRLQSAANAAWRVKLTTTRATYLLEAPRLDLAGVTVARPDRPLFGAGVGVERRVSWSEIERLEVQRPARGRGFARGALIGLGVGLVAALASADALNESNPSAAATVLIPIGAASCALIGGGIGAVTAATSERLYP